MGHKRTIIRYLPNFFHERPNGYRLYFPPFFVGAYACF